MSDEKHVYRGIDTIPAVPYQGESERQVVAAESPLVERRHSRGRDLWDVR